MQNQNNMPRVWDSVPLRTTKRGHFWIAGERISNNGQTYQHGPMYVSWETPAIIIKPYPIVLIHGGTLQGIEWLDTPDGRPGWAQRFIEEGYAVFIVDRPGHGRSPYHHDIIGPMTPPFSYERGKLVYFPDSDAELQTQWPFDPADTDAFDSFIAPYGPMPADLAKSEDMDADRLSKLLDKIGLAILVTHSASGPDGWLVADRRPGKVVAIVAVEPMGPVFGYTHDIGKLDWGLTAAPVTYDPPMNSPAEVQAAPSGSLRIPAMKDLPIAFVTGETSVFAKYAPEMVTFLFNAGAAAEEIHLPDYGIYGNGHGLIYEKNSDKALKPVLQWLDKVTGCKVDTTLHATKAADILIREKSTEITFFVSYVKEIGTFFNNDYYVETHLPLVMKSWEKYGMLSISALFPPDNESDLLAVAVCKFRDEDALHAALNSVESVAVMADVINYTNANPNQSRTFAF